MLAVTGPEPLTVLWRNGYVRACAGSPAEGDPSCSTEAPSMRGSAAGGPTARAAVGCGPGARPSSATRTGAATSRAARRSIAWRSAGRPAVRRSPILLGVPDWRGNRRRAGPRRADRAGSAPSARRASSAAATLREQVGPGAIIGAVEALAAGVGAADGALATYAAGNLLAGRSVRGLMAPRVVAVCAFDDLSAALHDGVVDWLGAAGARGVRRRRRSQALLMVPVIAAGERLGVLLLSFTEELPLGDPPRSG